MADNCSNVGRMSGVEFTLGESINVPPGGLGPLRYGAARRSHNRSNSEPVAATPFISKLPPAVAVVPKEDIRGYVHTKRVTHYLVGSTLGEGSFAKVKEAFHVLVGEKVAMKVIDKKKALQDPYVAKNFRREAKLLQMLRHPNILQLLEVIETENSYYLITELCSGGELMKHIYAHQRLGEEETRKYMRHIVSAVDHLHKAGIIHRDLKVENLLLDSNMDIKIIDFGLSNEEFISGEEGSMVHCSTQCGSPAYAAPELLGHKQYGPEVDIWSIGVNMYAMLTGCLPYTVEPFNISALHAKMLQNKMNPIPDHLSDGCKDLLRRLLTSNPEDRIKMPELMEHPWLSEGGSLLPFDPAPFPNFLSINDINEDITEHMVHVLKLEENEEEIKKQLMTNRPTSAAAIYHLLHARLSRYQHQFPTKTVRVRRRHKRYSQQFEGDFSDTHSIVSCPPVRGAGQKQQSFHQKDVIQPVRGKPPPISELVPPSRGERRLPHRRRATMPSAVLQKDLARFQVPPETPGKQYGTIPRAKASTQGMYGYTSRQTGSIPPHQQPSAVQAQRPQTQFNRARPPPTFTHNPYSHPQALNQLRQELKSTIPASKSPAWHSQPSSRQPSRAGSRQVSRSGSRNPSTAAIGGHDHLYDLEEPDDLQFHTVDSYTTRFPGSHEPQRQNVRVPESSDHYVHFPTISDSSTKSPARGQQAKNGLLSQVTDMEVTTEMAVEAIVSELVRVATNMELDIEQITANTITCTWNRTVHFKVSVSRESRSQTRRLMFQWLYGGDHKTYKDVCKQLKDRICV